MPSRSIENMNAAMMIAIVASFCPSSFCVASSVLVCAIVWLTMRLASRTTATMTTIASSALMIASSDSRRRPRSTPTPSSVEVIASSPPTARLNSATKTIVETSHEAQRGIPSPRST